MENNYFVLLDHKMTRYLLATMIFRKDNIHEEAFYRTSAEKQDRPALQLAF
jgi:hypothetical protein